MDPAALVCPSCELEHPPHERFCGRCGMPLVPHTGEAPDERRIRARKIQPRYAVGELVWIAGARNGAEAEFIAGMLLEEGIPSLVRRAGGFDVPDFLAGGPREVLVAQSGAAAARQVLLEAEIVSAGPRPSAVPRPTRLLAALLLAVALGTVVLFMATHVVS